LEKIVDGVGFCVAKDGTYTCASDQVLKAINDGAAAVCVNRDASYGCGDGQVLKNVNNGSPTCVDMDKAYNCGEGSVLQATSTGGAICVDKDRGWASCPWGEFVYAVANGVPYCQQVYNVPAQPLPYVGGVTTKHNDATWSPETKDWDCPDGTWVMGFSCTGKCNSNNMKVKCAKIQLVNP
jgi:hypothetical protein